MAGVYDSEVYNFSPGPAAIPKAVLVKAQAELLDFRGMGISVMEISHRSPEYLEIANQATQDVRELLQVPDNYRILFGHGGASLQFSMVPLNLAGRTMNLAGRGSNVDVRPEFDYVNTGIWSKKAIEEAKRFGEVNVVADASVSQFTEIPASEQWQANPKAAYLHFTPNETIQGLEFHNLPDTSAYPEGTPLVADMSSTLFSRPIDVSQYGIIYAGAQKNIGPSGFSLMIVRDDLLDCALPETPKLLQYKTYADNDSMFNTPNTFAWYMAGLVFQWLKEQGGVAAMAQVNQRKANKLYAFIDGHDFYRNPVAKHCRSWMNIPFILSNEEKDADFLSESRQAGLLFLKGHRMVGGMRASLYNAVPEEAVDALIDFMSDFANRHG